jgi:hypothetical protein
VRLLQGGPRTPRVLAVAQDGGHDDALRRGQVVAQRAGVAPLRRVVARGHAQRLAQPRRAQLLRHRVEGPGGADLLRARGARHVHDLQQLREEAQGDQPLAQRTLHPQVLQLAQPLHEHVAVLARHEPGEAAAERRQPGARLLDQRRRVASRNGEGAVSAEKTWVILYAIASWLRTEELIPSTAAHSNSGWKLRVREEWRNTTGQRTRAVERPRHAVDEVAALFAALPQADPRLRLLVELAAELRAGQAVRARRTDLTLDKVGGCERGRFIVYGAGKKRGETVDLHPEVRTLVDEVLSTGYLAEAEAAFQRGEVEDYFLFPAGKLKGGSVPLERATESTCPTRRSARCSSIWSASRAWSTGADGHSTGCVDRRPTLRPISPRTRGC